jgi:hypothetical protein
MANIYHSNVSDVHLSLSLNFLAGHGISDGMTKRPYMPAPVNIDAIDRTIERSIASIERSRALLSRLDADSKVVTCADACSPDRLVRIEAEPRSLPGL